MTLLNFSEDVDMSGMKRNLVLVLAVAAAVATPAAFATNGYFQHGYGVKAQGMGGAGIAFPQDAMAAATNPAGMVKVGDSMDFDLMYFSPNRETKLDSPGTATGNYAANETSYFFVPEFAWNKLLNKQMSYGIAVYGNGGMNTTYSRNIPMFSPTTTDKAGVDLSQLFVAPNMAFKITDTQSVGASLIFAYQRFKADGLANFDNASQSSAPGHVTNNGYDSSNGWGVRLGWMGQVIPDVTLGATYQPKIKMGKFDKYKGLFAEQGEFDIPSNYGFGVAVKAMPKLTVAFDYEKIKYSDSKAVHNPLGNVTAFGVLTNTLGTNNGAGFGWQDITVYKLGVSYQYSPSSTLRFGWNHNDQPIPASQTFFNILAPGVVTDHVTLGGTWKLTKESELSAMYAHAFSKEVKGSGSIPAAFQGYTKEADLKMDQNSLSLGFGWNY